MCVDATNKTSLIVSPEMSRFNSADPTELNSPVNKEAPGFDWILGKNTWRVSYPWTKYCGID